MTNSRLENYRLARERVARGQWTIDPDTGLVYGSRGEPFRRTNTWGYIQIKFRHPDDYRVDVAVLAHRVVWESVHDPLPADLTINHLNGRKKDNRIVNLEAVTVLENARHARATGLTVPLPVGELNPNALITDAQALEIYRRALAGEDQGAIGADYGISRALVSNIKCGWRWEHVTGHQHV